MKRALWVLVVLGLMVGGYFVLRNSSHEELPRKVAALLPLTGPASSFGQYVQEGMELALADIRKMEGREDFLQVIYEDTRGKPPEAIAAMRRILLEHRDVPVFISALSSVASVIAPQAREHRVVSVFVDVVKPGVTDGEYNFRVYPTAENTAGLLARFALDHLGARKAAILYINDEYGRVSRQVFDSVFSKKGRVVYADMYNFMGDNARAIVTKLQKGIRESGGVDVIYVNGYGPTFAVLIKTIREMGIEIQMVADVAMGLPENQQIVGDQEGIFYVDADLDPAFVKKFMDQFKRPPSSDAAYAYDVMMILYKVARETSWDPESIRTHLKNITYEGVTGPISFDKNGDANLRFVVKEYARGRVRTVFGEK